MNSKPRSLNCVVALQKMTRVIVRMERDKFVFQLVILAHHYQMSKIVARLAQPISVRFSSGNIELEGVVFSSDSGTFASQFVGREFKH